MSLNIFCLRFFLNFAKRINIMRLKQTFSYLEQMESNFEFNIESGTEFGCGFTSHSNILHYIKTLNFKLRMWAVDNNITHVALSQLLELLQGEGHISLPKDARTLLETPKNIDIIDMGSGYYWYGGLKKKLTEICMKKKCSNVLELVFHIDGLPIYKSSKSEFWPTQCSIKGVDMEAFYVSLYQGSSKPPSAEEFLRALLDEIHDLLENGLDVLINGKIETFAIKISKFILDAPARAFLKCIISHSGYFSCERCEEEGVYLCNAAESIFKKGKKCKKNEEKRGHVCLIGTNAPLRTNETFRTQANEEHHHDHSPLEELPIDMVRDFPLEYLHLILFGTMKKLLIHWTKGTKNFKTKFSARDITQISEKLVQAGHTKPSEINKPNRSLKCLGFWKATELRTFLLKTGPVVLREHLSEEAYNHFLALHCATTICCSKTLLKYLPVANYLFRSFNEKFGDIYGHENYTYSFHSIIHVADDVERFGVFDSYSAFPGESNLGHLKNLIRGGYRPLQQVVKRLAEIDKCNELRQFLESVDIQKDGLDKGILRLKDVRLDSSEKNRWILTKNHEIFKIEHISKKNNITKLHGAILRRENQKNLYEIPIESKNLCIYEAKLDSKPFTINVEDMFCKLYRIAMSHEKSAFFPLLHFTQ